MAYAILPALMLCMYRFFNKINNVQILLHNISVYDLSNCPIPDYPNCLETAQSCVHNSSFWYRRTVPAISFYPTNSLSSFNAYAIAVAFSYPNDSSLLEMDSLFQNISFKWDNSHPMTCLSQNTNKIRNIKSYLLTTLYGQCSLPWSAGYGKGSDTCKGCRTRHSGTCKNSQREGWPETLCPSETERKTECDSRFW